MVVKPDHIRLPVGVIHIAEKRRITGQLHRPRIPFQPHHIGSLCQGISPGIPMGCILSQEHLRPVRRKGIIAVVVGKEPFRSHVIMLIHQIRPVFPGGFPTSLVFPAGRKGACRIDNFDIGIFFPDCLMEVRIPFKKRLSHLFIAHGNVLQPKGRLMSQLRPHSSPFCSLRISIGKFYQIQGIINPWLQLIKRRHAAVMRIIASGKDRNGFGADILTKLEIFIIAQAQSLVVSPVASSGRPFP